MRRPTSRHWPRSARRRPNGRAAVVAPGLPALALAALVFGTFGSGGEAGARMAPAAGWRAAQASAEEAADSATPAQGGTAEQGAEEPPGFFGELDDLPLMEGLQEMPEASMAFDKPGGRIGEVYAEGAVPAEEVRSFYADTLPQLGWRPVGENRYQRDGERLVLDVSETAGTTTLRISLSPTD